MTIETKFAPRLEERILSELDQAQTNIRLLREMAPAIAAAAELMMAALRTGGKIMFCGNGGSAADAQHLAAELMGRFLRDRAPLPALVLKCSPGNCAASAVVVTCSSASPPAATAPMS
jgi:D-sedoheptulose 7-phosphate isomerase